LGYIATFVAQTPGDSEISSVCCIANCPSELLLPFDRWVPTCVRSGVLPFRRVSSPAIWHF